MSRGVKKVWAGVFGLSVPLMLLAGCIQISAPTQQVATPPVVVITQVVTEMIPPTPLPVTPTTAPSATPPQPTTTPTWDPLSAPIYYPIPDCVASRLHVGDKAMVSFVGGANGIRYGRDLAESTIIGYAQPGAVLDIQSGPWCSRGWLVWLVKTADGTVGYTPEGDGNSYWLLPVKK
jgi:hypothetical protein